MYYGFTFDEKHSNEFNLQIKTLSLPPLATRRVSEEAVLKRDSSYKFEDGYNDKIISLQCTLLESDFIYKRLKMREIIQWLDKKGHLILDYEEDKYYVVEKVNVDTTQIEAGLDIFTINFQVKPFAYSVYLNENVIADSGDVYVYTDLPVGIDLLNNYYVQVNTTVTLINAGTYSTHPIIEIDGTADNINITCGDNSFSIQNISTKIYIDCEKMICYYFDVYGKKQNKLIDFAGDFIKLLPGDNVVDITGSNLNCNVFFNYRNTYL